MHRWGIRTEEDVSCDCGEIQTDEHLLNCRNMPVRCDAEDLMMVTDNAVAAAVFWSGVT